MLKTGDSKKYFVSIVIPAYKQEKVVLRQRVLPRPRGRSCPTPGACFCRHSAGQLPPYLRIAAALPPFHDFFFVRFCFSRARSVQGAASSDADPVVGVAALWRAGFAGVQCAVAPARG